MLNKIYEPERVEKKVYDNWISGGYFRAESTAEKKPYTIVMPPPNITGQLHMGHALDNTLQDILIRWRRMQGYNALWLPGSDHASIATEAKIVEALESEGKAKGDLGREAFLRRAWEWKEQYGGRIREQLKKFGCSCDWDRERFTMDEGLSEAVLHVFVRLYEDGLIYKGERIINWCPHCGTSLSDIEVEYAEHGGFFWYIKYPIVGCPDEYVTVATTRPETMLGDTAVAVNPDDARYSKYIGKTISLPLLGREIPVISDAYADSELGSGAVKITPAHDPNDFDVGLRHGLEFIRVIDDAGRMNEKAGQYAGLGREEARAKIVDDLRTLGLIDKITPHIFNIGKCSRCNTVIEPIISSQWFVRMKPLAEPAVEVVREGKTRFVPERFTKIYYNWMENIQDWCISRQLWWGHRIPVYYCDSCGEVVAAIVDPVKCRKCSGPLRQDEDVLDTWFSSALWPFSTLGWPAQTFDYANFYPTDVLVTGYDIIFFWVARMIFSGVRQTGQTPFKYVYLHGMLRDELGRKMSKSLGNGIDPLEIIDVYGADALRFALVIGNAPGNDLRVSEEKIKAARNFANKLWNAARFVLSRLEEAGDGLVAHDERFSPADRWIVSELNSYILDINDNLEKFELGIALQKIYDFIWDIFCDWFIEFAKPGPSAAMSPETLLTLRYALTQSIKLLHPFMPFITEEIYASLENIAPIKGGTPLSAEFAGIGGRGSIMKEDWPAYESGRCSKAESEKIGRIIEIIKGIRNMRAEMKFPPSRKMGCVFIASDEGSAQMLEEGRGYLERLAGLSRFTIQKDKGGTPADASAVLAGGVEAVFRQEDLMDVAKEKERLEKELSSLEREIDRAAGRLGNPGFLNKAPAALVDEEKRKLEAFKVDRIKLLENIERLSGHAK